MEGIKFDANSLLVGTAAGAVAGGVLAYILARRSFNARLEDELAAAKHHYQLRAEAASARADAVERTATAVGDEPGDANPYGVEYGAQQYPDKQLDHHSAFIEAAETRLLEDLDLVPSDASLSLPWPPAERDRTQPYVISDDEFAEGPEQGVHQSLSVKWYDDDQVLVDDQGQPIPDIRRTTGLLSKSGFGGVSGDPNIRYVRNERLEIDFEIAFDERSYTEAVLNYGTANPRNRR